MKKKFNWTKLLVLGMIFALFITIPFQQKTQAAVVDGAKQKMIEEITDEQFQESLKAIKEGLYLDGETYKFSKERIQDTKLTKHEISNLEDTFAIVPQKALEDTYNTVNDPKVNIDKNELFEGTIGTYALPALIAAVAAVAAFVGAAIAAQIVADLYKLAAIGFCRKWKKYSKIKQVCKDLGYL